MLSPSEILHAATVSDLGVAVESSDPQRLQQAIYRQISKDDLKGHFSLCVLNNEVFVVRRANLEESHEGS